MNRPHWLSLAGALLVAVAPVPAAELYVDAGNMTGTEQGTQQNPFRSVQAAIDAAASGDEIRVAAGTYVENLRVDGKNIRLLGGYSSGWVRNFARNTTTLSGAGGNAVINIIEADATIDGFRITGGTGSTEELPFGYHGGGIYSRDGSPTISNNIIEGNDVRSGDPPFDYYFGGGIYVVNAANAAIRDNVVRNNFAGRGAGIYVSGQEALVRGNTIEDNVSVGDHGGGLFIAVVNARITQNIIRRNEVGRELGYGWGGGLIVVNPGNFAEISFNEVYENLSFGAEFIDEGAQADIHHELVYGNRSQAGCDAAPGIYVDGGEGVGSQVTIRHCTVTGNICDDSSPGIGLLVEGQSSVSVTNSIFWNNGGDDFGVLDTSSLSVAYTCSQEPIAGTGNISADPRFVDESTNDYRLASGSPCIDAGDPASPFDSEPAPNGGRADMGRYGNASRSDDGDDDPDDNDNDNGPDDDNDNGPDDDNDNGPDDDNDNGPDDDNDNGPDDDNDNGPDDNDNDNGPDDGTDNSDDGNPSPTGSTALCPAAAAMLLSITFIGTRRTRRRSPR